MKTLLCVLLTMTAPAASAQDVLSLFGNGAEAQAHAGAGQLASRNAPANYYNPANLAESVAPLQPYASVDVVNVAYTYKYPGQDPVGVNTTAPVPFFGLALRPAGGPVTLGISVLPIPGSAGSQKIKNLPTRQFADTAQDKPILIDVASGGNGNGVVASLGAGMKVVNGLSVGVSLLYGQGGSEFTARESDNGTEMADVKTTSQTLQGLVGVRGQAFSGDLTTALTVRLPAYSRGSERIALPFIGPNAVATHYAGSHGPLAAGLGVSGKVNVGVVVEPYLEYLRTNWTALKKQQGSLLLGQDDIDYLDTNDFWLGADATIDKVHKITVAYAISQNNLGDGIMASEASDKTELLGMQFSDLTSLPMTTYALGYRRLYSASSLEAGLSYAHGTREVGYTARGYGSYVLTIIGVIVGGTLRF